jgi:membrane protein YqaA with SNARE-associated domain
MGKDDPTLDNTGGKREDSSLVDGQKVMAAKRAFLSRELYLRILVILMVLGLTAGIFVFRGRVANLAGYGYLGAFLISLISSATILVPIPGIAVVFALGATYNPYLVGVAAGAGSALGELSGYMAGYSGQIVVKDSKTYLRMEEWMKRRGSIVIFGLSFVPNPLFDLAGMAAGVLRYPFWKFVTVCFLGKTPKFILVALAGAWALNGVLEFLKRYF